MQNPKEYYDTNGYYVFKKLISQELIDNILAKYQADILSSKKHFFRQSTNRWEKNKISKYGYSETSFRDIHDYPNYSNFSEAALAIFCCQPIREALTELTGSSGHNLMQSMFFDQNTETPAHQDWYYLDSLPNGHLLAGWFALEDIQEAAGRFYVLPKTNLIDFDLTADEKASTNVYVNKINEYVDTHFHEINAPALEKGDVLFWNSRTIHGALPTQDSKFSRKSLTAHYLPSQYHFGSRYRLTPHKVEYSNYKEMQYKLVPDMYKKYSLPAKIRTDLYNFLWEKPKIMRLYQGVKKLLKKSS
ncbi:MAG: phytanoyl-CoA dioxygenase family protein [Trichodesmium sp. St19_bin1]|nr:phytanoyl-CoA dioxygenase family protein [Trichodesmium sp. St19_bin1]